MTGQYSWVDNLGTRHVVVYRADKTGYHIVDMRKEEGAVKMRSRDELPTTRRPRPRPTRSRIVANMRRRKAKQIAASLKKEVEKKATGPAAAPTQSALFPPRKKKMVMTMKERMARRKKFLAAAARRVPVSQRRISVEEAQEEALDLDKGPKSQGSKLANEVVIDEDIDMLTAPRPPSDKENKREVQQHVNVGTEKSEQTAMPSAGSSVIVRNEQGRRFVVVKKAKKALTRPTSAVVTPVSPPPDPEPVISIPIMIKAEVSNRGESGFSANPDIRPPVGTLPSVVAADPQQEHPTLFRNSVNLVRFSSPTSKYQY